MQPQGQPVSKETTKFPKLKYAASASLVGICLFFSIYNVGLRLGGMLAGMAEMKFKSHEAMITENGKSNNTRRLESMDATAGIFSYVHISKCGGSTWGRILKQLDLSVRSDEKSVQYQRKKLGSRAAYHLTTLRSPRHHVFSMFMHCKYHKREKKGRWKEHNGLSPKGDMDDYKIWLDYHVPMGPENRDRLECAFHPANYQSRHLTSIATRPHGLGGGDPFEPDASKANQTYWELDFVGLTEFTHESRCLLYYRLRSNALPKAQAYLDKNCRCSGPIDEEGIDDVHVLHHNATRRSNLRDLPKDLLSKVEELTRIDTAIYNIALRQFLAEIAWLESKAALRRRVLCDDVLRKLEPELSYLPAADGQATNVTRIYLEAIGVRLQ